MLLNNPLVYRVFIIFTWRQQKCSKEMHLLW